MGLAVILGMAIPDYFSKHPIQTGIAELDQMFNILLNIQMFIGGMIAFLLDNTVGGKGRFPGCHGVESLKNLSVSPGLVMQGYTLFIASLVQI